jgi:hypothetical protein
MDERREDTAAASSSDTEHAAAAAEHQAQADHEAVRLGRFLPLGMGLGAAVGLVAGLVTHRFGICVPVGIALGILLAGTLPVFMRRR